MFRQSPWTCSALLSLALTAPLAARAQEGAGQPAAPRAPGPVPCTGSPYDQFDFWVGEWIVKDTKTGGIIAFDRIEKVNDGCALAQDVHQLNDQFRNPASPHRLHGSSITAFDGKSWRQFYYDNMGSVLLVSGGLDDKGVMVLAGDMRPAADAEIKAIWERKPDGTVHNYGLQRAAGGEWKTFFDVTYHPNRPGR